MITKLKEKYSFPDIKPDTPQDYSNGRPTGWCHFKNVAMFEKIITPDTKIIIDGGSWMGLSAWHFINIAPSATVICIDTWQGSIEHQKAYSEQLKTLYNTFIVNLWDYRNRVIPVQSNGIAGLCEISQYNIKPDIIYIDWSHDIQSVIDDVTAAVTIFPDAIICGDDYTWQSVKDAVEVLKKQMNLNFETFETCWRIKK